jgi:hypothetical protein
MPPGETDRGILQGLAAAELGGVSGGDESLGESLETPYVTDAGVGQGFMVAVTASRKCCAARVVTKSVGSS